MADERLGRDANRVPVIGGVTDDSDLFIKALRVDPTTFRLKVTSTTTLSNIEYDEGDTDASITGIAMLWEDGSDTLRAISAAKPLPVAEQGDFMLGTDFSNVLGSASLISGTPAIKVEEQGTVTTSATLQTGANVIGKVRLVTATGDEVTEDTDDSVKITIVADDVGIGGGISYTEDEVTANPQVGGAIMIERDDQLSGVTPAEADWIGLRGSQKGALWVAIADSSGDPITSFGGGTQYTEGATDATITGTAMMWEDGSDTLRAVSAAKPLPVAEQNVISIANDNKISTDNSTTSTLNGGVTYTGTGEDVSDYSSITIQLDSSHDSATDGMTFEFSTDDTNWDDTHLFTYTAADGGRRFQFPVHARYFRVKYTNGGTNQTHFRVQTILHRQALLTSIHRIVDDTNPDRSAQIVKAAIVAQKGGGGPGAGAFVPVQATAAGNFKMSVQEISDGLDIGAGNAGSETQRVSISTDDVNLSAIKTAIEGTVTVSGAVTSVTDTSATFDHGSNLDIDTAAEQITTTSFTTKRGVVLKADAANSGIIYIGNSDVTDGDTAATDGIPLAAGESLEIEVDNPNKLYAIGSAVNQKVYWMAV